MPSKISALRRKCGFLARFVVRFGIQIPPFLLSLYILDEGLEKASFLLCFLE